MRPPKTWFWQIKVNENYKNFVEIRKMINAGNDFIPIIYRFSKNHYSISFKIKNAESEYSLITENRKGREDGGTVKKFKSSDAALAEIYKLDLKQVVLIFKDNQPQ
jgi:hypothetical protein